MDLLPKNAIAMSSTAQQEVLRVSRCCTWRVSCWSSRSTWTSTERGRSRPRRSQQPLDVGYDTGFYRFCLARGYVRIVPLPPRAPKCPQVFTGYIYSEDEIKRLLQAAAALARCNIDASTSRTLLLLLYATGLRISEALHLNLADVDLNERVLQVRETKFYKTRLVPIGTDLTQVLREYALQRFKRPPLDPAAPFLLTRRGQRVSRAGAEDAFKQLREQAEVQRVDGARYQPRLQDLRHAFAVTRLVRWYREGADVQRLLPQLATLGRGA
jgi:site-specific recombinase XerD